MDKIENLEKEIRNAMSLLNIEYLPRRSDLYKIDKGNIESAITKNGGYRCVGKMFGIPTKGATTIKHPKWTDEEVCKEILEVINELGLNRMPTRNEIFKVTGDCCLPSAISRGIGYRGFANKLGLDTKDSETTLGKNYEHHMIEKLTDMGYCPTEMPQNFPYDILLNNSLKIDIKFSYLYKGDVGNFYSYNLEKPFCTCDIYVLISQPDESSEDIKYRIIPSPHIYKNTQVSVGELTSKYNIYIDRWDYIDKYLDFYNSIELVVNR